MFFNDQKSKDEEAALLREYLRCLDDIDIYLDEFDEVIGLALYEDDPVENCEKLTKFLRNRLLFELIED